MTDDSPQPRIVITGIGAVSALGVGAEPLWEQLMAAAHGIRPFDRYAGEVFPTDIAAQVDESVFRTSLDLRRARRLSRSDRLAVIAAAEAVEQAGGTSSLPLETTVVSTGTSTGGLAEGEEFYIARSRRGGNIPISTVLQQPTSGPSDAVASWLGTGGGVFSNATACASAAAAIGVAADLLRAGMADAAVAGGTDALCRLTYSGFNVLQAVDSQPCRPFDASRAGITLGEGAGFLVLEREDDARARGATILAELAGWGATCDAHHPTAPAEDGRGAERAMNLALADAGLTADAVDYVNAHGTGTPLNDSAESLAISRVTGAAVPVSSTKSFFGHTLGASGGIEAVVAVLSILRGSAPPTLRLLTILPEGEGLDFLPASARAMELEVVMSNSFGFGGSNVSLVLRSAGGGVD